MRDWHHVNRAVLQCLPEPLAEMNQAPRQPLIGLLRREAFDSVLVALSEGATLAVYSTARPASYDGSIMNRRGYIGQKKSWPGTANRIESSPTTHEVSAREIYAWLRTSEVEECAGVPYLFCLGTICSDSARAACE